MLHHFLVHFIFLYLLTRIASILCIIRDFHISLCFLWHHREWELECNESDYNVIIKRTNAKFNSNRCISGTSLFIRCMGVHVLSTHHTDSNIFHTLTVKSILNCNFLHSYFNYQLCQDFKNIYIFTQRVFFCFSFLNI